jgi:hypothetical protein
MCHKHCLIPCKFTAVEFERLVQAELDFSALYGEDDGESSAPVT